MKYLKLLSHGSKIGAAAVGGAIEVLAGPLGPGGTAISAALREACTVVLDDLAQRYLSPREEQRVADVAALAIDGIRDRLLFTPRRDDGFFDREDDAPSPAEELFEGVLLSAKQEHEQLKLPYLANFYTNLAFASDVKRAEANYLLTIAEVLTYRQLCILSLANQLEKFIVRDQRWPSGGLSNESRDISQQAVYLYQRQLLVSWNEKRTDVIIEAGIIIPKSAFVSTTGQQLFRLLGLENIPKPELLEIAHFW
ncbi:hypothetical protein PHLH7_03040 [Pseudomonas sp. Ost2]|uniref:hypothetical protein n=1 Tax=Pseudomonas sp. Ost2 TaxID=2678260 RepID=UPI001BB402A7|nr:hypothetical protein [Pseudomonas sp. Ost2]BBP74200.1 hypothetical protein PHLH7_03040 [Pseudomonas sp. Ost2]